MEPSNIIREIKNSKQIVATTVQRTDLYVHDASGHSMFLLSFFGFNFLILKVSPFSTFWTQLLESFSFPVIPFYIIKSLTLEWNSWHFFLNSKKIEQVDYAHLLVELNININEVKE